MRFVTLGLALVFVGTLAQAAEPAIVDHSRLMDHGDGHLMDMDGGMVMGQNKDKLPAGCDRISEDVQITVHAGRKYSKDFPGTMFGFDKHEWKIKPCTRLTVNFINEDPIRHQWMMHGLPKFMYDKGMFHLEITGPAKIAGTLILPAEDRTYLVHCDIAQHMEKGMKGQLVVGKGSGTFPTIPGITDPAIFDNYSPTAAAGSDAVTAAPTPAQPAAGTSGSAVANGDGSLFSGSLVIGMVAGVFGAPMAIGFYNRRLKGKPASEIVGIVIGLVTKLSGMIAAIVSWIYRQVSGKDKYLPKE